MEISNTSTNQEDFENKTGKKLAVASVGFYIIAAVAALIALFLGTLGVNKALNQAGAPDAVMLSNAIMIGLYGQLTSIFASIVAIILHRIAFTKYEFRKSWFRIILLICSCITLFASAYPLNVYLTIVSLITIVHLLFKRQFYFD